MRFQNYQGDTVLMTTYLINRMSPTSLKGHNPYLRIYIGTSQICLMTNMFGSLCLFIFLNLDMTSLVLDYYSVFFLDILMFKRTHHYEHVGH